MKKRIAIDLVPIRVGEGGTGSGIWTYAYELIHHMDQVELDGLEIFCLVNAGQRPYLSGLSRIQLIKFPEFGKNILFRLLWIHVLLPLICIFYRVDILHKLATETSLFCPARRVTTVHDFYYEFLMENHLPGSIRLYERLEKLYFTVVTYICFHKSRAIIAVSNATKQEALDRYPKSEGRIHVIHHGVMATKFDGSLEQHPKTESPELNAEIENKVFNLLCVAKFMEHKGQHLLIDAFEALLEHCSRWVGSVRLTLRGFHNDEAYYAMICKRVSESRFSNGMEIIPFNADDSLVSIYQTADLVILLSSYEGFGLPVLEAQGMGVPVLCSNLPVLREVGGDGAVYVERENISGTAKAIQRFVEDPEYYAEVRARAMSNIDRFSWFDAAKRTISIYKSC